MDGGNIGRVCAGSSCSAGVTQNAATHACSTPWDSSVPLALFSFQWSSYKGLGWADSAWLRASLEALPHLCPASSQPLLKAAEHKKQLWGRALCSRLALWLVVSRLLALEALDSVALWKAHGVSGRGV